MSDHNNGRGNHSFKRTATERRRQEEEYGEPVTDDLEIAATFAMAQYASAPVTAATKVDDENEINVEDEDEDDEEGEEEEEQDEERKGDAADTDDNNKKDTVPSETATSTAIATDAVPATSTTADVDSDAESDVDLTEALRQMEQDGGDIDEYDEERKRGKMNVDKSDDGVAAPQTIHEVDGYRGSVQQVEQVLGTSLYVDARQCTPQHTHPAGHVQHFMVEERIMVVQSLGDSPLLLEEGNLLVLKDPEWIPLGKILEVFGPVSQPMYSIRLPEPVGSSTEQAKVEDPWSPSGRHTKWIQQQQQTYNPVTVHYLPEQATLVDTHMLLSQRQRGCDASNIHDEEVTTEMDFSDDEQERQFSKQRRRKPGNNNNNSNRLHRGERGDGKAAPVVQVVAPSSVTPGGFYSNPAPAYTVPTHAATITTAITSPPPVQESDTIYYD